MTLQFLVLEIIFRARVFGAFGHIILATELLDP